MVVSVEAVAHTRNSSAIAGPRTQPISRCPICESNKAVVLFETPDRLHGVPGLFTYKRCNSCRTVFQDPRVIPEDLSLCYPSDYYTHTAPLIQSDVHAEPCSSSRHLSIIRDVLRERIINAVQGQPSPGLGGLLGRALARSRRFRERAFYNCVIDEVIPRSTQPRRALDIGCGSGWFINTLKKVGWEIEGVEWDSNAASVAREHLKCRIWEGDFRKVDLPVEEYGLVTLHHVFEHLDNPVDSLRRIYDLLAPGGRAVLIYPNPESVAARLYDNDWFPWEVPRHLVFPSPEAVADIAANIGRASIRVRTTARNAAAFLAHSRAYREGNGVNLERPEIGRRDSLIAGLERVMVSLGFRVGEEVIVVLQKDRSANYA